VLTYYQKELIFFFFLPLQFRGANVQGGEGPLAEAQGGQLERQEEPLTVQAKTEPLPIRSKLFIDQDLVSPLFLDRVHRHQERRECHHLQLSSQYVGIEDTKMSTDSQEEYFSANSGSQGGLLAE
jgi:hypothetical protein